MPQPSQRISSPPYGGYRCPVSGETFLAADHSREAMAQAHRDQQSHTANVTYEFEQLYKRKLSLVELQRLYQGKSDGQK